MTLADRLAKLRMSWQLRRLPRDRRKKLVAELMTLTEEGWWPPPWRG